VDRESTLTFDNEVGVFFVAVESVQMNQQLNRMLELGFLRLEPLLKLINDDFVDLILCHEFLLN
jgi:hypothetical protein